MTKAESWRVSFAFLSIFYLYILRGFKKFVMHLENVKNAPNLIRKSLFLKKKKVKIVIQKKKILEKIFFLKISTHSFSYLNMFHARLMHFFFI